MSLRSLIFASIAALAVTASAHATTYGLAGSIGATPTFAITSGGNTATFTSTAGNSFLVQSTSGLFSFNTALVDDGSFNSDPLTVSFSNPVSGTISFAFGFEDAFGLFGPDSLTLTTNTGQSATFGSTLDNLILQEPEGFANFSLAGPITSFTLNGTSPFGIGDVTTVTPEPTSLVLLITGLTGVVGAAFRRRQAV